MKRKSKIKLITVGIILLFLLIYMFVPSVKGQINEVVYILSSMNVDEVIEYIDFGLLNGISGIVLALMAQRTGNDSPLAEMFFMQ